MRKKILFVTNSMIGGGAEKILQVIVSNINKEKFDISICSLHESNELDGWPKDVKYYSIYKHKYKNRFERLLLHIGNKIKLLIYNNLKPSIFYRCFVRGTYDTEIAFIEGYATRIVGGSTNKKSKKLAWLHTDMCNNHWSAISYKDSNEERMIYGRFNKIVGVSKSVAESISKLYPEVDNVIVLYNPIDERLIVEKSTERISLKCDEKAFKFISIGRLVVEKGYDRVIPLINELNYNGYNIQLYLIGDGAERSKLEKLIKDLNLEDKVFLLGFKDNPYPYLKACDAFICSSRIEGLSTVVAEALILGLPVVATNCAGMNELLGEHSEYGIIVNNDIKSLKEGLITILNPAVFSNYKRSAHIRGKYFKLENLLAKFEKIL